MTWLLWHCYIEFRIHIFSLSLLRVHPNELEKRIHSGIFGIWGILNFIFPIFAWIVISSLRDNSIFRNSSPQCAADVCTSVTHHKGAANTLALSVSGSFAKTTSRPPVLLNYSNKKEPIILSFFLLAFTFHFRSKTRGIAEKQLMLILHRIK